MAQANWHIQWTVSQFLAAAAAAKLLQSCPTLCDPRDGSPPGSPIPGILQARILEWVAISFSNAWKWKVKVKSLSHVRLLVTPWIAAHQAPPSVGFSRQEYWSGVPLPSPGKSPYMVEKRKLWFSPSLTRSESHHGGSTLMPHLNLIPPKDPTSCNITIEGRASTYEFGMLLLFSHWVVFNCFVGGRGATQTLSP